MSPITDKQGGSNDGGIVNRRDSRRKRVLKGATITFNNGYAAFECVVRNLSNNGALLAMGESLGLPPHFQLAIVNEKPRSAHIRWRTMSAVGVAFD